MWAIINKDDGEYYQSPGILEYFPNFWQPMILPSDVDKRAIKKAFRQMYDIGFDRRFAFRQVKLVEVRDGE